MEKEYLFRRLEGTKEPLPYRRRGTGVHVSQKETNLTGSMPKSRRIRKDSLKNLDSDPSASPAVQMSRTHPVENKQTPQINAVTMGRPIAGDIAPQPTTSPYTTRSEAESTSGVIMGSTQIVATKITSSDTGALVSQTKTSSTESMPKSRRIRKDPLEKLDSDPSASPALHKSRTHPVEDKETPQINAVTIARPVTRDMTPQRTTSSYNTKPKAESTSANIVGSYQAVATEITSSGTGAHGTQTETNLTGSMPKSRRIRKDSRENLDSDSSANLALHKSHTHPVENTETPQINGITSARPIAGDIVPQPITSPYATKSGAGSTSANVVASTQSVAKKIIWTQGGDKVYVTGTFVNWDKKYRLRQDPQNSKILYRTVEIPRGTHHIVFIVDGVIKVSNELPITFDNTNTEVNYIEVCADDIPRPQYPSHELLTSLINAQTTLPASAEPNHGQTFSSLPTPPSKNAQSREPSSSVIYGTIIPPYLLTLQRGDDTVWRNADPKETVLQPPSLPVLFGRSVLSGVAVHDDNSALDVPSHTILNHLATGRVEDGVVVTSMTTRYKSKYLTTVTYMSPDLEEE